MRTRAFFLLIWAIAVIVGVLGLATAANAQMSSWCDNLISQPPSPPQGPTPPVCNMCNCTGSPCYVSSGTYITDSVDLRLPTSGFALTAARHYESTLPIDGPLGLGWSSNLVPRIYYATYLFSAPSTYQNQASLIMPDGSRYTFIENVGGMFSPPVGRYDTLVRNGDGTYDLTPQRTRSRLHFAADGSLLATTDEFGNALNWTYDGSGRLQQVADASGSARYLNVFWGPDGRISAIQDSAGRQVQYGYNAQGNLTTVTDAAGRVTTYSYTAGRFSPMLSQIRDHWNRVVSDITYDSTDRVRTYSESGETYTYTYSYSGNPAVTAKTDTAGKISQYTFSPGGPITDRAPPSGGGGSTHTDFYPDGLAQQVIDPVGVKTYSVYNSQGNPLSVTRDYQGTIAVRFDYVYDSTFPEKVASITPYDPATGNFDPNWQGWRYDYYPVGSPAPGALHNVYRLRDDGSATDVMATYEYDSKGRVTHLTSPTGGVTDYAYDSAGNLSSVTAPSNDDAGDRPVTTYGYDSLGRVTSVTDPLGHSTTYTYDAMDRVLSMTPPKPSSNSPLTFQTTYTYDTYDGSSGALFTQVTDPNGKVSKQGYNQFGQLARTVDALNNVTLYGYTRGLLTSITDANSNATTYTYDPGRRLASTTFPNGAVESYTYTADGLLYQKTDRKNQIITYSYDRHKRLATKAYPGGSSMSYTYQGQKLSQIADSTVSPTETHTFSYDGSYRLASETQGPRGTVSYQYNPDDSLSTYFVQGGPTASYTYYPNGSLNTIGWTPVAGSFKYAYTSTGQYQQVTFPNGQTRAYGYDDQGRLLNVSSVHPSAGALATYSYGYDLNQATGQYDRLGQRVSMAATVPSQGLANHLTTYEYDSLYQLTKATYPNVAPFNGEVDSWSYDAIGNRLTNTVSGTTQTYSYQKIGSNPNNWQRLLNDGANAYTYDSNGNTLTRNGGAGNFTFGWSTDDKLTSISGATTASYKYDYQGRRTAKTVGTTTTYLYRGLDLVRETGASTADYLIGPGIDEPLAMSRSGAVYYYAGDGLGSVSIASDEAGGVQSNSFFDAWGQTRSQVGTLPNPFGYTAREFGESGSLFYRARYLSPGVGRFLSEDPLRYAAGIDLYTYVYSDPISSTDPRGLDACVSGCAAGGPPPHSPTHVKPTPRPSPPRSRPTPTPKPPRPTPTACPTGKGPPYNPMKPCDGQTSSFAECENCCDTAHPLRQMTHSACMAGCIENFND
jgi:RHS repeat-associated protein